MSIMTEPPPGAVNHWDDFSAVSLVGRECKRVDEHCQICGQQLLEHYEMGTFRSRRTGAPTYMRMHSCPTWVLGWRTKWRWTRLLFLPGYGGHDSHDADNPLSARGYR